MHQNYIEINGTGFRFDCIIWIVDTNSIIPCLVQHAHFAVRRLTVTCHGSARLDVTPLSRVYTPCARMRTYTPTVGATVYTSVAGCAQRIRAHTPTVAVKVQTCWTFKASADQRRPPSQSRKRSKVTEGRRVVLHRDVCGRIPTHTLVCLYFYPRRNLRYAGAIRRQPQAWTSAPAAGAYARMEYKPSFNITVMGQISLIETWCRNPVFILHSFAAACGLLDSWNEVFCIFLWSISSVVPGCSTL